MLKKIFTIIFIFVLVMMSSLIVSAESRPSNSIGEVTYAGEVRMDYWARISTTSGVINVPPNTYVPGASAYYVRLLQCCLNKIGKYGLVADGVFGTNTYNAIFDFQAKNNLSIDGTAGASTWKQIDYLVRYYGWSIKF